MGFASLLMKSLALVALSTPAVAWAPYCLAENSTCFPQESELSSFNKSVGGRLIKNTPYAAPCYKATYDATTCQVVAANLSNPQWRVRQPAAVMYPNQENDGIEHGSGCLAQPIGVNDSAPAPLDGECVLGSVSSYIVNASSVSHIIRTVKFAAKYNLRFRIKNSGHDYFGRSTAEGAFTLWTHYMNDAKIVEDFRLCGINQPQVVLSAGPGIDVEKLYDVTGKAGYVAPGGYTPTVGVSGGFVLGGGTGPLGAIHGMGVDNVLQFEVVTADGQHRIANQCSNVDLFWALRGGGGAFGVVTRIYYKVYPAFSAVTVFNGLITCPDNGTYSKVISTLVDLQVPLRDAGHVGTSGWNDAYQAMVVPSVTKNGPVGINIYNLSRLISYDLMKSKEQLDRVKKFIANLSPDIFFLWQNDVGEASTQVKPDATSVHPDWRKAFAFVNVPVVWPWNGDAMKAYNDATMNMYKVSSAFNTTTAYSNEDWNHELDWQTSFWGTNYPRLAQIKREMDPNGVFNCPSCVGSEEDGSW